jgi:hypothetical protein
MVRRADEKIRWRRGKKYRWWKRPMRKWWFGSGEGRMCR